MAVETTRGDILHLVAGGAMTPEDAEAEALRLGFEPFEIRPDPSQWDPMGEVVWTLPMALAWIIWRSRKMVRHMWDSYRKRFRCWHFQRFDLGDWGTREGHELIEGGPAQLSHIMAAIKRVPPASSEIKCVEDAVRLLRLAAQRGAFTARAVTPDGGRPRDIPPAEWSHLDVIDLGGTTVLRFPSRGFPDAGYDMVTIPRKDFIGNFRPLAARQGQACHPAGLSMFRERQSWMRSERQRRLCTLTAFRLD